MTNFQLLANLGWCPFFQQQLTLEEWDSVVPARIVEQHKSIIELETGQERLSLSITPNMPTTVVGDWVLLNDEHQYLRLLERKTCFRRKSAGEQLKWQLIAANVDTAFIVCSLNEDFNLNRIERYLSLVNSAEVEPVIVLTKSDLVDEPELWMEQITQIDSSIQVVAINALDMNSVNTLHDWLGTGKTVVILGSSGVGKSTITNGLLDQEQQATSTIREDDAKGRHTTTRRSLLSTPEGALILDTPGMRELQIADCKDGITSTFSDIENLASHCRFGDCRHVSEPGCAILEALSLGELDVRRLKNYQKLVKEEAINSYSLAEKRAQDKALGKFYKRSLEDSYKFKGRQ